MDGKGTLFRFHPEDLLTAVESFHGTGTGVSRTDDIRYREMIADGRPYNLDLILPVLTSWRAHRGTGDARMLRCVLSDFVSEKQPELDHLRATQLLRLSDEDLRVVKTLVEWLENKEFKPTAWGKSLHMLAPNALLLWDEVVVRRRYDLAANVEGFLSYQRFGQRLAKSLGDKLEMVLEQHASVAGYAEPIPKILDELAFEWDGSAKAVLSLGGHLAAFM